MNADRLEVVWRASLPLGVTALAVSQARVCIGVSAFIEEHEPDNANPRTVLAVLRTENGTLESACRLPTGEVLVVAQPNDDLAVLKLNEADGKSWLIAVDLQNSKILWKRSDLLGTYSAFSISDMGTVYAASLDRLYAVNSRTGEVKWEVITKNRDVIAAPVGSNVFFIDQSESASYARLVALNEKDGSSFYTAPVGRQSSIFNVANGTIVLLEHTKLVHRRVSDGNTVKILSIPSHSTPVALDSRGLLVLRSEAGLLGLSKSGKQSWTLGRNIERIIVSNAEHLLFEDSARLYRVDYQALTVRGLSLPGVNVSSGCLHGDAVVVTTFDGYVYMLR